MCYKRVGLAYCIQALKTVSGGKGFVNYDFVLCQLHLHHVTFIFTREVEIRQSLTC